MLQKKLNIPVLKNIYALNGDIKTLFDTGAFNINYFTPDVNSYVTDQKSALGKKLFYDQYYRKAEKYHALPVTSRRRRLQMDLQKSKALAGEGFLPRNTYYF